MSVPQGGRYDLSLLQGSSFSKVFAARESDGTTVVPLTGYAGRAQMRTRPGGDLLLEFTVAVDADDGTVTLSATDEETAEVARSGVYDIELEQAGEVIRFVSGNVTLSREVTVPIPGP